MSIDVVTNNTDDEQLLKYARAAAKRYGCSLTKEEREQAVQIGLWQASISHDITQSSLSTYVYNLVKYECVKESRQHQLYYAKHKPLKDPESRASEGNEAAELLDEISEHLEEDERRIVELKRQGFNNSEIATTLNMTRQTVAAKLNGIKNKLEE